MTQLLKTLALTLGIVTTVTAPSLAKGSRIFDLEGSGDFSQLTKFNASVVFENPLGKLDDSFLLEKIAPKAPALMYGDGFGANFNDPSAPTLATSGIESVIFNPTDLEEFAKKAERAKAEQAEAKERAAYEAFIAEHNKQVNEKYEAHLAALTAPSLGDYVYSAGAYAYNQVDYIARSWPAAFLLTYVSTDTWEEVLANIGYASSGYTGYYGVKAGFMAIRLIPCVPLLLTCRGANTMQTAINYTLDTAQVAAKETVTKARFLASYIWPSWA